MFRIHLARCLAFGAALFLVGCNSSGSRSGGLCSSCGDRPGLLSRFRTTSTNPAPMLLSSGDCCDRGMSAGPYLPPPPPPSTVPPSPQPINIPRIDENAKQMPFDPKMGRPGIKTGNENRSKEGI